MEIIFPTKINSLRQERPSYPVIRVLRGGKTGSQFPGLGDVILFSIEIPGVLPGRLFCIGKGGSATAGIPNRVFLSGLTFLSCPSTRKCRLLSLLGIGGCRSVVKGSTGASATASIPDRISLSGFTSLSWAPSTSFLHDIQAISSHAKASPSATGESFPCSWG